MKLLMIYMNHFAFRPRTQNLDNAPPCHTGEELCDVLVAFVHAEEADEQQSSRAETHLVKNLKWGARKNQTQSIVLHSFAHLAETKASADFTRALLDRTEQRLLNAGYQTTQTPFGYFVDLNMTAPGRSTARIFASF